MKKVNLTIDWLSGNCPVQAEGTINGQRFYFRARGSHWSMSIGGTDIVGNPTWYYEEKYGEWPDAGWMEEDQAKIFIDKAIKLWIAKDSVIKNFINFLCDPFQPILPEPNTNLFILGAINGYIKGAIIFTPLVVIYVLYKVFIN